MSTGFPSVEVLLVKETGGASDGDGGSTGGPSIPVVAPADLEGDVRQSKVGTVAGETARLLEAIIGGVAAVAPPAATTATAALLLLLPLLLTQGSPRHPQGRSLDATTLSPLVFLL